MESLCYGESRIRSFLQGALLIDLNLRCMCMCIFYFLFFQSVSWKIQRKLNKSHDDSVNFVFWQEFGSEEVAKIILYRVSWFTCCTLGKGPECGVNRPGVVVGWNGRNCCWGMQCIMLHMSEAFYEFQAFHGFAKMTNWASLSLGPLWLGCNVENIFSMNEILGRRFRM